MRPLVAMSIGATLLVAGLVFLAAPSQAEDAPAFYANKKITLYIGFPPGGGYDIYSRLIARHLGNHIPGKPLLIPQNMPGGSSRVAASYLYNVASKDDSR